MNAASARMGARKAARVGANMAGRSGADDLDGGEGGIGRIGDPAAVGEHRAQAVKEVLGDYFAWGEHRDTRRVRRDDLRADPARCGVCRDRFVRREKRLPG